MFKRYKYTLLLLFFSSGVSALLVLFRVYRTTYQTYLFLLWNLFLAWIPLLLSMLLDFIWQKRQKVTFSTLVLGSIWLLFYPNAPYIMTDLLHLAGQTVMPLWFDMMLILSFAWTGLFLGFVSLYLVQNIVKKTLGAWLSWLFVLGMIGLGSFGVFLGRFLRYNSWDFLSDPKTVTYDVLHRVTNPLADKWSLLFTFVFSFFSLFTYLLLYAFSHLHKEWE